MADTSSCGRLFALVPINQLSSDFTRIDGTVFTGEPGRFMHMGDAQLISSSCIQQLNFVVGREFSTSLGRLVVVTSVHVADLLADTFAGRRERVFFGSVCALRRSEPPSTATA